MSVIVSMWGFIVLPVSLEVDLMVNKKGMCASSISSAGFKFLWHSHVCFVLMMWLSFGLQTGAWFNLHNSSAPYRAQKLCSNSSWRRREEPGSAVTRFALVLTCWFWHMWDLHVVQPFSGDCVCFLEFHGDPHLERICKMRYESSDRWAEKLKWTTAVVVVWPDLSVSGSLQSSFKVANMQVWSTLVKEYF